MIHIYHNPRCRKSREALARLEESGKEFKIVEYLKNPLSAKDLTGLLDSLEMNPLSLVRKGEAIWKEQYKGKDLSDAQVIEAMAEHPKLIERPIITNGNKAVVARPAELMDAILN